MKTANLLPSRFFIFVQSACGRDFGILERKSHKPEVGSSSLPLDTTSFKQSQNIETTVYTAFVGFVMSLFLTKNTVQLLSHSFVFSSKIMLFVDFYCRVTAELVALLFNTSYHHHSHPP